MDATTLAWPYGNGAMCARIREQDWANTPLGPIEQWPEKLKAVIEIMLAQDRPMAVLWGADNTCLYNDAYSAILGSQHPAILGQPLQDVWPATRDANASLIGRVRTGETISLNDGHYRRMNQGALEDAWFDVTLIPLRDQSCSVAGVLVTMFEVTARFTAEAEREEAASELRKSEQRQSLLAQLTDALRSAAGPWAIAAMIMQMALDHFAVDRCWYCEIRAGEAIVFGEAKRGNLPPVCGTYPLQDLGDVQNVVRTEQPFAIADLRTTDQPIKTSFDRYLRLQIVALLSVPVLKDGEVAGVLCLGQNTPRAWTEFEVALASDTAERTWAAVQRARTQNTLRESEERLRLAMEVGRLASWDWDLRTGDVQWNAEHFRIEGYALGEVTPSFETWVARVHPDDREDTTHALMTAKHRRQRYQHEFRTVHPDGSVHWCAAQGVFFEDEHGAPSRMVGIMEDITDRKRSEQHRELLIHELNHRVKNTLATVQSLVSMTLRHNDDPHTALAAVSDRLLALSTAHDVLTREHWAGAGCAEVVQKAICVYSKPASARFQIAGSDLQLGPNAALALTMALHELATNAVKYGALSNDTGNVGIRWETTDSGARSSDTQGEEGAPEFLLQWTETAGPTVQAPPHSGFGMRLIEESLRHDLAGEARFDFDPAGLRCELVAPLSEIQRRTDPLKL